MYASAEYQQPVFDDKVRSIIKELAAGKSREKLAQEMGYTTYKSIDMYLRRKNFKWDPRQKNYVPDIRNPAAEISFDTASTSTKALSVISLFDKHGSNSDPRTIAKLTGFKDHLEMAAYMRSKNYRWDTEKFNYIQNKGRELPENDTDGNNDGNKKQDEQLLPKPDTTNTYVNWGMEKYMELLETLEQYKDRLLQLILPESEAASLPRYVIPGVFITKSVHMSNNLDRLVKEFSAEKNISQRDIFEVALVNFFRQYGYRREIDALLGS